jgi:hypothetical protein
VSLAASGSIRIDSPPSLYARLLGSEWTEVDEVVRRSHLESGSLRQVGRFRVQHGTGTLARWMLSILRLPSASEAVATELAVTSSESGERWTRRFGDRTWSTTQIEGAGGVLVERMGVVELRFRLQASGRALIYRQIGAALRWGLLSVALPGWLSPRVEAREEKHDGEQTRVSVVVRAPLAGLLIAYDGIVSPEGLE